MKKGLVLVLFALVSVVSYAQIAWSVKAGMTMNNMTKLDDSKVKVGYTVGVGADYAINEMWSVLTGLNITSKGLKYDANQVEQKFNPVYLELPILAGLKFDVADNMKFVVNAGPYLAVGLGGKYVEKLNGDKVGDMKLFKKENGASDALMKRFDMGLQYGVGLELSQHYLVNLSGQCGFISPFDAVNQKGEKVSPKNIGFAITVGYKF